MDNVGALSIKVGNVNILATSTIVVMQRGEYEDALRKSYEEGQKAQPLKRVPYLVQLMEILRTAPAHVKYMRTTEIGELIGKPWRDISKNYMTLATTHNELAKMGWEYVPQTGRIGGGFGRT